MTKLKSRPADPRGMRRRIESALEKHGRGERLTEPEETIVYWLRHGGGCHACGGIRVAVAPEVEGASAENAEDKAEEGRAGYGG